MAEGTVHVTHPQGPEPTWETDWVEAVPQRGENQRVVLWEDHPQHPTGEAFIVPGPARLVALTPMVNEAIRNGLVRRVAEPALTLEEHLHHTGQHGEVIGEYHHIAKAAESPTRMMNPRLRPTARDRVAAEPRAELAPNHGQPTAEPRADEKRR